MRFSNRMELFESGIFTVLAQMKRDRCAQGKTVIDLSVGSPNIPPAPHIRKALADAALLPENYTYAIRDLPALREAMAGWYARRFGVTLDPRTQVVSLLGSQDGLGHIALTLADPGDLVLVPDPCYPAFSSGPLLAGAELHFMPQRREKGYLIDLGEIPEEVARRARLMIVSYPNNPTTALAPDSFYRELIEFAKKYDIAVLHDNAYAELVFDGKTAPSFLAFEGACEVGVEFNSLSKTFGMAGARVGFCLGNSEICARLDNIKSNIDYGIFLPVQLAAVAALTGDQGCVAETRAAYAHRRDVLCAGLRSIGWNIPSCAATMFVWAELPEGYRESEKFVRQLFDKSGVLFTPGSAFGPMGEGYVRMALVQDDAELRRAVELIAASGMIR